MKKLFLFVLFIVIILGIYFLKSVYSSNKIDESMYFTIESGQSFDTISQDLLNKDLISSKFIFKLYAKFSDKQSSLLAGQHYLEPGLDMKELLEVLTTGGGVDNELSITIIEGWRIEEIADYLSDRGIVDRSEFLAKTNISLWRDSYDFLADVTTKNIEGFIFPDTYRIFQDATSEDIIKKALDNFDSKLKDSVRQDIAKSNKNIFEVVTLASIIEREVPKDDDKKMIADIFLKRLRDGIALQSDATVNYVTGGDRPQPTFADLKVESPYNTYLYRGLTPGPISNPGVASIEAVVYPTKNEYYYFLTTLDDGRVIYGRTYQDHLNNKAKYLD